MLTAAAPSELLRVSVSIVPRSRVSIHEPGRTPGTAEPLEPPRFFVKETTMRRFATLITIALTTLALMAGCETVESEDADVLDMEQLALTVDSSTEAIDEDADFDYDAIEEEEEGVSITDPDPSADRVDARRAIIKEALLELAEDEPCAIRGIVGGRTFAAERDEAIVDGAFRGRAWRRSRQLVARGAGVYMADGDADGGGSFTGQWENLEDVQGSMDGEYFAPVDATGLGTFDGSWEPEVDADGDGISGGNVAGVWHKLGDGSHGFFVGYYSRCDLTPRHLD